MPLTSLSQGDTTDLKDAADALDKRAVATSDSECMPRPCWPLHLFGQVTA